MNGPNETSTVNLHNTTATNMSPQDSAAGEAAGELQGAVKPSQNAANKPPGEQLPLLSKPSGTLARSLPEWDLEPPAFLVRRGEEA